MTLTEQDKELREKILNDWLIHEAECSSSLYGEPCDCIQRNVATNIMQLITADRKRVALEARTDELKRKITIDCNYDSSHEYEKGFKVALNAIEDFKNLRIAELKSQQEEKNNVTV